MVTNWTSLGSPPSVQWGARPGGARNIDGRLEVFALDSAGALWHIQQTSPGMNWNSWASLGVTPNINVLPDLVVEGNADGRLEIFALDSAGALWHTWQTSPGDGWFHWSPLGRPLGGASKGLAVTQNADGRLEVFTLGNDGAVWHIWQVAPNSSWSRWASLAHPPIGAPLGGPVVGTNADGRLEVFAVVSQDALWHIWQTSPGDGWFHWFSSGRPQVTLDWLDVIQNADGRLEVFALAEGRSLWHIWQTAPNGPWSPWTSFGNGGPPGLSHIGAPHAAKNADGRLEVFLTAPTLGIPDIVLWHISQVTSGGSWGDWTSFDTPTNLSINSDVSVSENADGRLEVFLTNSDQTLWHAGQVTPGAWSS